MSLLILLSLTALGADVFVDPTGAGDHLTVGAAVAAAASGDRLVLQQGDYSAEAVVVVDKSLEFYGNYGASTTIIPRLDIGAGSDVVLRQVTLSCEATDTIPAVAMTGVTVEMDGIEASVCSVDQDRLWLEASNTTLWIHDSGFEEAGQVLDGSDVDLTMEATVINPLDSPSRGIDLFQFAAGNNVLIADSTFVGLTGISGDTFGYGGLALSVFGGGDVTITDTTFRGNVGSGFGSGGALALVGSTSVTISGSTFEDNYAPTGGAISTGQTPVLIQDTEFVDNIATDGGGAILFVASDPLTHLDLERVRSTRDQSTFGGGSVVFDAPGNLSVLGSWFCGNGSIDGGAALTVNNAFAVDLGGTAVALSENTDAVSLVDVGRAYVRNVTFAGPAQDAIRVTGAGTDFEVTNTIFHDSLTQVGVFGVDTSGGADPLVGSGSHNNVFLFNALSAGAFPVGTFTDYQTSSDPQFLAYTAPNCDNINLWLDPTSVLRDLGFGTDLDGTPADIGAFGGLNANLNDLDGDLVYEDLDCDDNDPAVSPNVAEIPYDGIDQDCTGADLVDVDGDGHDGTAAGGPDCDDEAPTTYPGADDAWYDGVDANCDGANDYDQDGDGYATPGGGGGDCNNLDPTVNPDASEIPDDNIDQNCDGQDAKGPGDGTGTDKDPKDGAGCGCSSTPTPTGLLALPMLALAALRRRRDPQPS